jgi:PAS domain S-box-containing protein
MAVLETIRILYIEDDEDSARVTLEYLKQDPDAIFKIKRTCTLEKAMKFLENECFDEEDCNIDIILLDLVLPNSHGVATYKQVAKKCKFIPVVIISGHEDLALKCMKLGAQEYLVKPLFTASSLKRVIKYSFERSKATKRQMHLERKFKQILYNTPLGFHNWQVQKDKLILVGYNPAADDILKIDHSKLLGLELNEAFPSMKNTGVTEEYKKIAKEGGTFSEVREYKDENIKHGFFKIHAFRISHNNITVSFEDITAYIKAKNTLNETLAEYKRLVEVTNASIFGMDFVKQKFTYVNDIMCDTLGYSREELLQMWPTDYLTPKSAKEFNDRIEALKRGEYIHDNVEYECLTKDGSVIWVLVTTTYPDIHQPIIVANAVAINITEQKLAEKAIKEKEEVLFNELEDRLHQWREELTLNISSTQKETKMLSNQLKNLTSQNEVV